MAGIAGNRFPVPLPRSLLLAGHTGITRLSRTDHGHPRQRIVLGPISVNKALESGEVSVATKPVIVSYWLLGHYLPLARGMPARPANFIDRAVIDRSLRQTLSAIGQAVEFDTEMAVKSDQSIPRRRRYLLE